MDERWIFQPANNKKISSCSVRGLCIVFFFCSFFTYGNPPFQNRYSSFVEPDFLYVGLCLYQSLIGILFVVCENVSHLRRCGGTRLVPREIIIKYLWSPISHDWGHHAAGEEKPHSRTSKLVFKTLLCSSLSSPMALRTTRLLTPRASLCPQHLD